MHLAGSLISTGDDNYNAHMFSGEISPVIYRKQPRFRVDNFDYGYRDIYYQGADRILFEIFQQKSDEWVYEKEHRITLRLEQADKCKIFNLDQMENDYVKSKLLNHACHSVEQIGEVGVDCFTLSEINDDCLRDVYSTCLADLSFDPRNLYLFKVNPAVISICIYGHNFPDSLLDTNKSLANSCGRFSEYKANIDNGSYFLNFTALNVT